MILFASTIGLSAFLLFLVQPIIAKQILPWFGGSSAVWTTCMVFFQCALLAGYSYADMLIRRVTPQRQALVHTALLLASLAALPIIPSETLKPSDDSEPAARILVLLALTIGLPYLMLSTTGPLVQAWFARRYAGREVYRLYALSNVASMGALIAYPPLIEPLSSVRVQSWAWSAGYAVFAVLASLSAWTAVRSPGAAMDAAPAPNPAATPVADVGTADAPRWHRQLLWLTLSALGSILLVSTTTHLTQNVASVPFLWVLPLALYLLTFILCFDGRGWYRPRIMAPLAAVVALGMIAGLIWRPTFPGGAPWVGYERGLMDITHAVPLYALGLFVLCMFCHGELVERKPAPQHLTRFYLMVSLGGAVGGLLVGLVAPTVYDWTWELPQALTLVAALVLGLAMAGRAPVRGVVALTCLVCAGAVYLEYRGDIRDRAIDISRNFHGTLRVRATGPDSDPEARWRLLHGVIIHGEQYRDVTRRTLPTTYYGETSGVGLAIVGLREAAPETPQRVGMIGLGVGTLAAYGRAGDHYRIYEINPKVIELARERFSYLQQSPAEIVIPLGDARLVLEREAPQRLHLLAIDAFSSDSIPVHLITREAMAAYRRHVRDDGAIAFHISNRYLDLSGVVRQLADSVGWAAVRIADYPPESSHLYGSTWVVITRNAALLDALKSAPQAEDIPPPEARPWTDDFNNLFEVLK